MNITKKLLPLLLLCFAFAACNKYDDTGIKDDIADLQSRVTQLETLCGRINENATSLQTIVTVLQNRDAVTGVTTITENGKVIGYTINFITTSSITIYNGTDGENGANGTNGNDGDTGSAGQDGHTPIVGVKLHEGVYYWTIDGEFLIDGSGNKIRAQAQDGANGANAVAPQFRIRNGRWELSIDGGTTWVDYGAATGNNGFSYFKSVDNTNENVLVLTLNDDSSISLPKYKQMNLTLNIEDAYGITAGGSIDVPYLITGGGNATKLTIFTQNGWKATQSATTDTTGTIRVTAPANMTANKVVIIAEDGTGRTVMQTMTFVEGIITLTNASMIVAQSESTIDCPLSTNADYTVEIPAEAQSWLSVAEIITTRAMRDDVIKFRLTANTGIMRYTTVKLVDNGSLVQTLFVMQNGSANVINVETAGTLSTLVPEDLANNVTALKITGTLNADDYTYLRSLVSGKKLTDIDLSGVTDTEMPGSAFRDATKLVKIIFPAGLRYFPEYVCYNCQNLESINIPTTVTEIRQYAFVATNKLATTTGVTGEMFFPDNVEYICNNAFSANSIHYKIIKLHFGSGLKEIGNGAFRGFDFVEEITFGENLKTIGNEAFAYLGYRNGDNKQSSPRPAVILPNSLRTIGSSAFASSFISSLDFGTGVRTIGSSAFSGANIVGDITIPENVTALGENVFIYLQQWVPAVLNINADVTVIPVNFCQYAKFKQVVMKNQVTEIRSAAFSGMSSISTPLVLPTELVKIGDYAFQNGSTFTGTLNLPSKLETIGNYAFQGTLFTGTLTIPDNVKTIGAGCFANCGGFTGNLVIPNNVTSLGSSAFYKCSGFNGTLTIGTGVTVLAASTFRECTGLTGDIYIPNNIQQIRENAFYGCTGFNGTLHLPENASFTTLYGYAFQNCNNLTGVVTLPANLTYLGGYSFSGCSKLSGDLNLENVTRIDAEVFRGCTGLNGKVVLGANLTTLGSGVFYECANITKFQCMRATPPAVSTNTFYGSATSLEVPVGAAAAYQAATTWKDFSTITEVSTF